MTRLLPCLLLIACNRGDDPDDTEPVDTDADTDAGDTDASDVPMIQDALGDWCGDYQPGTGVTAGEDLWKVTLTDPAAVCNDGTPGVMYIRPAASPEYADQWVFYLQGGSACTDLETCAIRWCGTEKYTKAKMSTAWTADSAAENALFTRDGTNPFGQGNQVMLYYCSSDQWVGTKADTVLTDPEDYPDEAYRLHFRGHEIVRAAIDTLLAGPVTADTNSAISVPSLADADRVLWSGSSAGGRGAAVHLDWLAERLAPNGTEVVGWIDANLPIVYDDLGEHGPALEAYDRDQRWPVVMQGYYGMFVDASCAAYHDEADQWRCGFNEHFLLNHVTTPFFVRQDLSDAVIGALYLGQGLPRSDMAAAWALTVDRVLEVPSEGEEGDLLTKAPGVYAPNCGQHVGLNDPEWFTGTTVRDDDVGETLYTHRSAFGAWYLGGEVEVLDGEPRSASVCADTNDDGG